MALPNTYRMLIYLTVALVLTGLLIGSAMAEAPSSVSIGEGLVLQWLTAAGFPAWALVVLYLGQRGLRQIQEISMQLQKHVSEVERRLARLEAKAEVCPES